MIQLALISLLMTSADASPMIGGRGVVLGGSPQTCMIQRIEGNEAAICTGTLTSKDEITTAAHCFDSADLSAYTVRCGYQETERMFQEQFFIKEVKVHSEFRTGEITGRDIARVTLDRVSGIAPIQVIDESQVASILNQEGADCKTEGFGVTNEGKVGILNTVDIFPNATGPSALLHGTPIASAKSAVDRLKLVQDTERRSDPKYFYNEAKKELKIGGVVASVLGGDSGGPLFCHSGDKKWKLVGVTSFGTFATGESSEDGLIQYYIQQWATITSHGFVVLK